MKPIDFDPHTCSTTTTESGKAGPLLEERLPAREVAKILGVQVGTLSKWRYLNRGPKHWLRVSASCVTYPKSEVSRFLAERTGSKGGEK